MTILAAFLIVAAIAPLLILGLYLIASRFNSRFADGLLDATALTLQVQWTLGCIVNVVGGVALMGLGVWLVAQKTALTHRLAAALIVIPAGMWRAWRGYRSFPRSST